MNTNVVPPICFYESPPDSRLRLFYIQFLVVAAPRLSAARYLGLGRLLIGRPTQPNGNKGETSWSGVDGVVYVSIFG